MTPIDAWVIDAGGGEVRLVVHTVQYPRLGAHLVLVDAGDLARLRSTLDAYERLWVRHGKLVAALRSLDREAEQRHALPSPHELRTGETREDVLRFYAEVRARQEGDQ